MKKKFALILALVMLATVLFSLPTSAATTNTVKYYDQHGNEIVVNGVFYNSAGIPCFNANSYYLDTDGNPVYVGGGRCYYYNAQGNLVAGNYYYDANGRAVSNARGDWGCGMWYYNAQGNVVNGTFYYDDFGNPIDAPAASAPVYRGGGCCRR